MCFKTIRVVELGISIWENVVLQKAKLTTKDTYCVIFGRGSDAYIEKFKEVYKDDINILHEDKAVNGSQQHTGDRSLRQHIIIFEKKQ